MYRASRALPSYNYLVYIWFHLHNCHRRPNGLPSFTEPSKYILFVDMALRDRSFWLLLLEVLLGRERGREEGREGGRERDRRRCVWSPPTPRETGRKRRWEEESSIFLFSSSHHFVLPVSVWEDGVEDTHTNKTFPARCEMHTMRALPMILVTRTSHWEICVYLASVGFHRSRLVGPLYWRDAGILRGQSPKLYRG